MNLFISIAQVLLMFAVPALILWCRKLKAARLFGTIGAAYALGILVSLAVFALNKVGFAFQLNTDVGQIGSHAAIGIAIPMLLFSANLAQAKKLAKPVLLSLLSMTFSVVAVCATAFFIFRGYVSQSAELCAMASGLYTGGTPNLNAIGNILGVDANIIALSNLSDMMIGGVFYVFLLLLCKPLLRHILPPPDGSHYTKDSLETQNTEEFDFSHLKNIKGLSGMFLLALTFAALGAGVGVILWALRGSVQGTLTDYLIPSLMITVTLLGIVASFSKKVRSVGGTNIIGHYLILVFSFALASSIDLTRLKSDFLGIFLLFTFITVASFVLHIAVCRLLKVDTDCAMTTLTAGIYGPAFVPAVTKQLGNDSLTAPGLICGSLGYAGGTFLGILLGLIFRLFY